MKKGRGGGGGVGRGEKGIGVKMLQTYRHQTSDIQTYRPSDEGGPRGAFAPKKGISTISIKSRRPFNLINCTKFKNRKNVYPVYSV